MKKLFYVVSVLLLVPMLFLGSGNANAQGQIQTGKEISGFIAGDEKSHRYTLNLTKPSEVTFEITSEIYYATFSLLDDLNETIQYEYLRGSISTPGKYIMVVDLLPGQYVFSPSIGRYDSYTGKYSFKTTIKEYDVSETEPNNGTAQANEISFNEKATGHLAYNDRQDFYSFEVEEAGIVTMNLEGFIESTTRYTLFNENNVDLTSDYVNSSKVSPSKINKPFYLEKGVYFLRISSSNYSSYSGRYNLNLTFNSAQSNEIEPNSGTSIAQSISFGQKVKGFLGYGDETDFYEFKTTTSGKVKIYVKASTIGRTHFTLLDVNNNRIDYEIESSSPQTPAVVVLEADLYPGTYFIKFENTYNYYGSYEFNLEGQGISQFKDYARDAYWVNSFVWGMDKGIIKGNTSTMRLNPYGNLTEAQWLAMIFRYATPGEAKDDPTTWYKTYYKLADKYGIAYNNQPNSPIRRGDVARVLAKAVTGETMTERDAVQWMYDNNITTGSDPTKPKDYANFKADTPLLRAHAVAFLHRVIVEQDLDLGL